MSLLAETVVEEYFNYHGYFTIRGVKKGNDEIDLLAVYLANKNKRHALHIEVQVSTKPVKYISDLTGNIRKEIVSPIYNPLSKRSDEILKKCVDAWVTKKFTNPKKVYQRNKLYPGQKWQFLLVHGRVRDERELKFLNECSVNTKDIRDIIHELSSTYLKRHGTSSTGRDIINLFRLFYEKEIKEE